MNTLTPDATKYPPGHQPTLNPAMAYRRFGRTELAMPVFSCGGMRYQQKWNDIPLSEVTDENQANLQATIHRAVSLGIHHIETARGYGSSERQLGLVLPKLPRERLIVQTKIGPRETADQFTADFEDSLARLQLDYVDLLAIHGINDQATLDQSIRPGGCLAAARKIQKRGLARFVGFATHGPPSIILKAIGHGQRGGGGAGGQGGEGGNEGGFDYVNLHWYYIYQENWPAIELALRRDMGVFIISPSDKGGKLYDPPEKLVDLCRPLHPLVFNDLFCLSHRQVHTLSIGASRPSDFDEHVKTVALLNDAEKILPPILERLAQAMRDAVGPELANPFRIGLPTWEQTPGEINLPIILWLRNLMRAYGMTGYGQMRYNLLGNGGHWFPGKNAAEWELLDVNQVTADVPWLRPKLKDYLKEAHEAFSTQPVKRLSQSE